MPRISQPSKTAAKGLPSILKLLRAHQDLKMATKVGISSAIQDYLGEIHANSPDHPSENFRGCTHPTCVYHRELIVKLDKILWLFDDMVSPDKIDNIHAAIDWIHLINQKVNPPKEN